MQYVNTTSSIAYIRQKTITNANSLARQPMVMRKRLTEMAAGDRTIILQHVLIVLLYVCWRYTLSLLSPDSFLTVPPTPWELGCRSTQVSPTELLRIPQWVSVVHDYVFRFSMSTILVAGWLVVCCNLDDHFIIPWWRSLNGDDTLPDRRVWCQGIFSPLFLSGFHPSHKAAKEIRCTLLESMERE